MPRKQEDQIIDAAVERALANLGPFPREVKENLRRSARLALKLDPRAQEVVRMLRDRPSVQQSGVVGLGEESEQESEQESDEARGGRGR
jgi:hypothetical protein